MLTLGDGRRMIFSSSKLGTKSFLEIRSGISRGAHQAASARRGNVRRQDNEFLTQRRKGAENKMET
jgi:hypothetical protein